VHNISVFNMLMLLTFCARVRNLFNTLCIIRLFNDALLKSIALNKIDWWSRWWLGKDFEGGYYGLFESTLPASDCSDWGKL